MNTRILSNISLINLVVLESRYSTSEKEIAAKFVEVSSRILKADYGYSFGWNTQTKRFFLLYQDPKTPFVSKVPRIGGITAQVFKSKQPQYIAHAGEQKSVRDDAKQHMKGVVVIPVAYKRQNYGTLDICFYKPHFFTKEEKILCEYIGNSAGQALTIFRLNHGLQKAKNNLEDIVTLRTTQLVSSNHLLKKEIEQRKSAEEKLAQSEIKFRSLIENTLDIFTMIDEKGVLVYESSSVERIMGYAPGELLGKTIFQYIHEEDKQKTSAVFFEGLQNSKRPYKIEFRFLHKDGTWRHVESVGQSFLSNPAIGAVVMNSRDITKRKIMEEQIKENQILLAEAQTIAQIGSWEWEVESDCIRWSVELSKIYGLPENYEGTYQTFLDLITPEDRTSVNTSIRKALNQNKRFEFYYRINHVKNGTRTLFARGQITKNTTTGKLKIIGTGQDVTERRRAEQQLKAYTTQLEQSKFQIQQEKAQDEALLASIGEGILATDAEGKVILINPQAEKILHLKKKKTLGASIFDLKVLIDEMGHILTPQEKPAYKALHSKKNTQSIIMDSIYALLKTGEKVPLSITATPVVLNGKITGAIEVFRDVTTEKEIDRAKSELISLASHQLRTPLSAINWYTEALLTGEIGTITPEQKTYLGEIFRANKKMVELVYDFLNVSRMELGTFNIKLSPINLKEITQGILNEIKPLASEKKIRITEHYAGNPVIQSDIKIITLILQNIITNAVKYTPQKGKISIALTVKKVSSLKENLHIEITDTGYGIPKNQQPKIFSKLFRADNIAKLDTEGTGLGLYLVKSFVDLCKGKITFKSQENKGTSFFITLPLTKEEKAIK